MTEVRGTEKKLRTALYGRVSTQNGQDVGLQLDELRQVAQQRGWEIVEEFIDEGISGSKVSREGLDAMLDTARRGKLDLIAVWRLDRLGRSLQHLIALLDELAGLGVQFVSLRDAGIDSTSPSGRFMLQVIGAVAEFERAIIRERVIAGVRRAQAKGKHCGRPRVEFDLRPALAMLEVGYGLKVVSKSLNVSRATLRRRLEEAGEWPRGEDIKQPAPTPPLMH